MYSTYREIPLPSQGPCPVGVVWSLKALEHANHSDENAVLPYAHSASGATTSRALLLHTIKICMTWEKRRRKSKQRVMLIKSCLFSRVVNDFSRIEIRHCAIEPKCFLASSKTYMLPQVNEKHVNALLSAVKHKNWKKTFVMRIRIRMSTLKDVWGHWRITPLGFTMARSNESSLSLLSLCTQIAPFWSWFVSGVKISLYYRY